MMVPCMSCWLVLPAALSELSTPAVHVQHALWVPVHWPPCMLSRVLCVQSGRLPCGDNVATT